MRDLYLYDDVPVLRNLLGIKDADELEQAEADILHSAYANLLYDVISGLHFQREPKKRKHLRFHHDERLAVNYR